MGLLQQIRLWAESMYCVCKVLIRIPWQLNDDFLSPSSALLPGIHILRVLSLGRRLPKILLLTHICISLDKYGYRIACHHGIGDS